MQPVRRRNRRNTRPCRGEHGFITLMVLILGTTAFLLLGTALQAGHRLHRQNRAFAQQLEERAEHVHILPEREPRDK